MRTVNVVKMERLLNTINGNPMWRIKCVEGVWDTMPDTYKAYAMNESDEGTTKVLLLDKYDRVMDWHEATTSQEGNHQ